MKQLLTIIFLILSLINLSAQKNIVDEPVENFEYLWKTFQDRYANFELKGVNWDSLYRQYRPLIDENTSNIQLYSVCCEMLQELSDGHVSIYPDFEEDPELDCDPPYSFQMEEEFTTREDWLQLMTIIRETLHQNGFVEMTEIYLNDETHFQYSTSDSIGYLRLDEMTEKITFGKFSRSLDEAILAFQGTKGVIIDLRFNGGGWDQNAYRLASRLIPRNTSVGHYEHTRKKGTDQFSKLKYREIRARGKHQYTGPVVILTSDDTASASEVFLLLMKDQSNVILIGNTTEGIFSDTFEFSLPNGWEASLSHQQFFCQNNINYEGIGIEPDITLLNTRADLTTGRDAALTEAIKQLTDHASNNLD